MKTTTDKDGTITYKAIPGRKTTVVVQQDPLHRMQGNPEGIWYVFKMTPKRVFTEYEGSKHSCIEHAEQLATSLSRL